VRVASPRWLATTTLALFLAASNHVQAGSLQASPILLEFAHGQNSQTLWLANTGHQPLRAQIRVQEWNQVDQQDVLQPSDALLASPPLTEIPAGQSQLVRVVQATPGTNSQEKAFRLIVDELPGDERKNGTGLHLLLRYSIPAFVLPPGAVPQLERTGHSLTDAQLLQGHWKLDGNNAILTLRNSGTQRIRISQLSWAPPSGPRIDLTPGLLGYVLAGAQMRWTLPLSAALPVNGTFYAKLNDDTHPQPLPQITAGQ